MAWLELERGWSARYELAEGAVDRYDFHLEAGEYLQLVVEQLGTDAAVALLDPEGVEQLLVNSWNGTQGSEPVEVQARRPGTYRLEVRGDGPAGHYELRALALRAATPEDNARDRAARAFSRAEAQVAEDAYRDALGAYEEAARHWRAAGEPLRQAIALSRVGWVHEKLGEIGEAASAWRRSFERFGESEASHRLARWTLQGLATATKKMGDPRTALAIYEQALELAREAEDGHREVSVLNDLAVIYRSFGKTRQATTYWELALARLQELDDPAQEARILANASRLYLGQGELERARALLVESLRLAKLADDSTAESRASIVIGTVERRRGRLEVSRKSLERSLELRKSLGDRRGEASALRELAMTLFEMADYPQAFRASEQALDLARELQNDRIQARVLADLGWFDHHAGGDPERALARYREARGLYRWLENRAGEASTAHGMALAKRDLGELEEARSRIEEAIALVESLRSETSYVDLRSSYLASKQDYYELYIDLLVELDGMDPAHGLAALALETSERRRVRALLDVLTQAVYAAEYEPTASGDAPEGRGADVARGTLPRLTVGPRLRPGGAVSVPRLRLPDVQRLLDDDTVLLEYSLGAARSFLWWVTPTEVELHRLPSREKLRKLALDVHRLLSESRGRKGRAQLRLVSDQLSRLLLGPVRDRLGSKRLLIVADGALRYVPFGALPLPRGPEEPGLGPADRPRPLVSEHEIVYVPSLTVLAVLRQKIAARPPAGRLVAVVADPVFDPGDPRITPVSDSGYSRAERGRPLPRLDASLTEAEAILAMVPEEDRLALLGFDASRENVLGGALADTRFVHFATHALFDPRQPSFSGLVLSRVDATGQAIDGYLRPHEIYGLSLAAEMVVLSACRTGLGREVRGEGLVGLTESFLYAGASRVLVSFWQVDDEATAELMQRLYRHLFEDDLGPAAALRRAQLSMLREPRWQAPYYWAAFVSLGEWRWNP